MAHSVAYKNSYRSCAKVFFSFERLGRNTAVSFKKKKKQSTTPSIYLFEMKCTVASIFYIYLTGSQTIGTDIRLQLSWYSKRRVLVLIHAARYEQPIEMTTIDTNCLISWSNHIILFCSAFDRYKQAYSSYCTGYIST